MKDVCLVVTGCSTNCGEKIAKLLSGITDVSVFKIDKIITGASDAQNAWILQFKSVEERERFHAEFSSWKSEQLQRGDVTELTVTHPTAGDIPASWQHVRLPREGCYRPKTMETDDYSDLGTSGDANRPSPGLSHSKHSTRSQQSRLETRRPTWSLSSADSRFDSEEEDAPRTVEVAVGTTTLFDKTTYLYYFESPRNEGGEVEDVIIDRDQQLVFVAFKEPAVALRVAGRHHMINGQPVHVRLRQKHNEISSENTSMADAAFLGPPPGMPTLTGLPEAQLVQSAQGLQQQQTVMVPSSSISSVMMPAGSIASTLSAMNQVQAQGIDKKQVQECPGTATTETGVHPNQLFFQNISDTTTPGCLNLFLRHVTGLSPESKMYGDEPGTVLVTFDGYVDLKKTQKTCLEQELEGRHLKVAEVPISNWILVSDLHASVTKDLIRLYFQSSESSGGRIKTLDMMPEEKKCYIYFEDYTVVDRVLQQSHKLDDHSIEVTRYTACLGPTGGSKDPLAFPMPTPVVVNDADQSKLAFLKTPKALPAFCQELSAVHGLPKFVDGTLIVECSLSRDVPKVKYLAVTWREKVTSVVENYLRQLQVHTRKILNTIWQEVSQAVTEARIEDTERAALIISPKEALYIVVGYKSGAEEMHEMVQMTVQEAEDEIQRRKEEITERKKLKPFQAHLLSAIGFPEKLSKLHKTLKVEIFQCEITIHGNVLEVKNAIIRMHEKLEGIKSEKLDKLPSEKVQLMERPEARKFISEQLHTKLKSTTLYWEVDGTDEVTVHAFEGTDISKALQIIRTSVSDAEISLSPRSQQLIQSEKWQNVVQQLTEIMPLDIIQTETSTILLIATSDVMEKAKQEIEDFVRSNTICTEKIRFSKSRQKVFVKRCPKALREIEEKYQHFNVTVELTDNDADMVIEGQEQGVEQVKLELESIEQLIVWQVTTVTDDAEMTYLGSARCRQNLERKTAALPCAFSDREEEPGMQTPTTNMVTSQPTEDALDEPDVGPDRAHSPDRSSAAVMQGKETSLAFPSPRATPMWQLTTGASSGTADAGCREFVDIKKGEIALQQVDVIVNSTNVELALENGGVSASIRKKAGPQIQTECETKFPNGIKAGEVATTDGYQLKCQQVYHSVLPGYRSGSESVLGNIVTTCLRRANRNKYSSIAFPALGTGNLGYPHKVVALTMLRAIHMFQRTNPVRCLKEIKIVVHTADNDVFEALTETQKELMQTASQVSDQGTGLSTPYDGQGAPCTPLRMQAASTGGATARSGSTPVQKINLSLELGEIATQKVDVIVNSTSTKFEFGLGKVSSSLLKQAGKEIADECTKNHPNGIQEGEVAITKGYKLACKAVVHAVLPRFKLGGPMAKVVEDMTAKCLATATQFSSIAFPVFGTGNLGYPPDVVAQGMVSAVDEFQRKIQQTNLKEVKIVVYPQSVDCWKAFDKVMRARQGAPSHLPTPAAAQSRLNSTRTLKVSDLTVTIKDGNIADEDVNMIVNSTNKGLDLGRGAVSSALAEKCGKRLVKECAEKRSEMEEYGFAITEGYDLKDTSILHIEAEMIKRQQSSQSWGAVFSFCLNKGESNGSASCAMPLFGAERGVQPTVLADEFFASVGEFSKLNRKSLREIRVVVRDIQKADAFFGQLKNLADEWNKKNRQGMLSKLISNPPKQMKVEERLDLTMAHEREGPRRLVVYADSQKAVDDFMNLFHQLVQKEVVTVTVKLETLTEDQEEQEDHIKSRCRHHNVQTCFSSHCDSVVLHGLKHDVLQAKGEVEHYLRQSLLAGIVRWFYLRPADRTLIPYELDQNSTIESAYLKNQDLGKFRKDGKHYIIDFSKMEEYPQNNPSDVVVVCRRINSKVSGIQPPVDWAPQKKDVILVSLGANEQEYQTVENNLMSSLGNNSVTVIKIERVQNKPLYDQYQTKKQQLAKQNPGIQNEYRLWHGTAGPATDSINRCGFNRGYCGKNAVRFGQGVYFAVSSGYSVRQLYSPPDPATGERRMYQCAVLVGYPTEGEPNMRLLPNRAGSDHCYDSATDDTENPTMYVIFNDTQAYPEYLITFK